jgi:hypothetical protein
MKCLLTAAAASCGVLLPSLTAQDMIGVTFAGQVLRMDSTTGAVTTLASGQAGKNCLCCTNDNRLISTVRSGSVTAGFRHHLVEIDPFTGAERLLFGSADVGDLRGLVALQQLQPHLILGVRDVGGPDELVRLDLLTGAVTVLGATGFGSIQDLDFTGSGLRAWDLAAGLLQVNGGNGAATDPFPGVGGPAGQQFLVTDPRTFQTFVGGAALHPVQVGTGTVGAPLAFAGNPDLRGAVFTAARTQRFGSDCGGVGGESNILALGTVAAGQALTIRSTRHDPGGLGVQIVGFSEVLHAGQALPIQLDPLLGTVGCRLHVSIDLSLVGVATAAGNLDVTLAMPASAAFLQFYVQHAAFDAVPDGMTWTDGLRVRLPR